MNWKKILLLSMGGPIYAALTITAAIHGSEFEVSLMMLLVTGALGAFVFGKMRVRQSFMTGLIAGISAVWLQALFLPTYFANNPEYQTIEIPLGLSARAYTFLFAPISALVAGLMIAAVTWVISLMFQYRPGRGS